MRFSERIGIAKLPMTLQTDGISQDLRNSLWNLLMEYICEHFMRQSWRDRVAIVWCDFLKKPIDDLANDSICRVQLREAFDSAKWYEVLDMVEFVAYRFDDFVSYGLDRSAYEQEANSLFEEHFSGFRFVAGQLAQITSEEEIASIEESLKGADRGFHGAATHIGKALTLLSKRPHPDYLNSIKESISAIESVTKQLVGEKGGGISSALKTLDGHVHFHPGFRSGLEKLYGYSSDEDGIRHAILEKSDVGFAEAKFMLVACSAIVNFMIAKADQCGLLMRDIPKNPNRDS